MTLNSLLALKLPTKTITLSNGAEITVRGLSLIDVTAVVRSNRDEAGQLFERYSNSGFEGDSTAQLAGIGADLLEVAPAIASQIIAHGAGSGSAEEIAIAQTIPFPAQVEILEAIGELTFDAEGGPKKMLATVSRVVAGLNKLAPELRTSMTGSMDSEAKSVSSSKAATRSRSTTR